MFPRLCKLSTNLQLGLNVSNDEVNWKQDHHDGKAGKYGDTKHQIEQYKSNSYLKWTRPQQPEIRRRITQPFGVN